MNPLINLLLLSTAGYSHQKQINRVLKAQCNHLSDAYRQVEINATQSTTPSTTPGATSTNNMTMPSTTPGVTSTNNTTMPPTTPGVTSTNNTTMPPTTANVTIKQDPFLDEIIAADIATGITPSTGPFSLPPLEYPYNALEPYIDEKTLRLHHDKHHQTYVNNLNAVLSRYPEFYNYTLEELLLFSDMLPSDIRTQVINNGGGHYNHSLMWKVIGPARNTRPSGELAQAINTEFASLDNLLSALKQASLSVFGSGYAWLVLNPYGRLQIFTTSNQNTTFPLRTVPLLPIDVWEHAYYLKHQNERDKYIDNYFNVINWDRVSQRYAAALANLPQEVETSNLYE